MVSKLLEVPPIGIIKKPCWIVFDPVKEGAKVVFKWFRSKRNGEIDCESQSSVLEIPDANSKEGLWFCVAEFKDENNENCRITSEMFEKLGSKWKGQIPQLDSWPFSKDKSSGVQFTLPSYGSPSEVYKSTEKRARFEAYYIDSHVPAAAFFNEFNFFGEGEELKETKGNCLVQALYQNSLSYYHEVFQRFLKDESLETLGVQQQFPIYGGSARESRGDSKSGHFFADLAISSAVEGLIVPFVLFEQKPEIDLSDNRLSRAVLQDFAYYHVFCQWISKLHESHPFFKRHPCLSVVIGSNGLVVHGVIRSGSRVCYSRLFTLSTDEEDFVLSATKFFCGLRDFLRGVLTYIKESETDEVPPHFPIIDCCESLTSIKYSRELSPKVFEATAVAADFSRSLRSKNPTKVNEINVVVKFVNGAYPFAFHCECFKAGYAPEILAKQITPLYTMIVMRRVEGVTLAEFVAKNSADRDTIDNVLTELENALQYFHSRSFLHGDFRDANIMVTSEGKVKIVDFDWASKESKKNKYDFALNNRLRWPCMKDDRKEMVHDLYFLAGHKMLLGKMKRERGN